MTTKDNKGIKVVILGDTSVGKSSIVARLISDRFDKNMCSTIGAAFITKNIQIKNKTVRLEFWDTAGQEKYRGMVPIYYRGSKIVIIVYDITNSDSYEDVLKYWTKEIKENIIDNPLVCILGNKTDMEENRQVNYVDASNYCEENNYLFYEISAKTGDNITEFFNKVCKYVIDNKLDQKKSTDDIVEIDRKEKSDSKCCNYL